MRSILLLQFLFIFYAVSACGTRAVKRSSNKNIKRPAWLFEAGKGCRLNELCAVGDAAGSLGADIAARKNLAKIFETKISSSLNINTQASSQTIDQVVSGTVNEEIFEKVHEQTDQILNGVQIREIYEDDKSFYALAVLNKTQAAALIASEIKSLDIELMAFLKDGRRSFLNKALKRYFVRDKLNDRHEFLSGRRVSSPVGLQIILRKKKAKRDLGTTVRVHFKEVGGISEVNHLVISHLLENDFKVVTSVTRKSKFSIVGSLNKEEQHMKVKGFRRFKFLLQLKSEDVEGIKIGALNFSTVQTGRNLQHAYENAMPEIKLFLEDKLGELNID